jgi:prefoldin subunit 5
MNADRFNTSLYSVQKQLEELKTEMQCLRALVSELRDDLDSLYCTVASEDEE